MGKRTNHSAVCYVENIDAKIGPYWMRGGVHEAATKLYAMGYRTTEGWTYKQKESMRELVALLGFDVSEMGNTDLVNTLNNNTLGELV